VGDERNSHHFTHVINSIIGTDITVNIRCVVPVLSGSVNHQLREAFFIASVCCNVLATVAIASRLLIHRRDLQSIGIAGLPTFSEYTTLAGIITESALLYALVAIAYIVVSYYNAPSAIILSSIFGALVVSDTSSLSSDIMLKYIPVS
jgi:hypothetical protein